MTDKHEPIRLGGATLYKYRHVCAFVPPEEFLREIRERASRARAAV